MTQSPWRAPPRSAGGTRHRIPMRRSAAVTKAVRPCTSSVPTKDLVACSRMVSSFPEYRPSRPRSTLHAHAIAMHDANHLRWRQEHRIFLAFDAYEAESGPIGADDALGDPWKCGRARSCSGDLAGRWRSWRAGGRRAWCLSLWFLKLGSSFGRGILRRLARATRSFSVCSDRQGRGWRPRSARSGGGT